MSRFAERTNKHEIEEGAVLAPKFDENGLIPCIAADAESGEILMFAFMNEEALLRTIDTGEAHYWSRSRGELWHKGATSGHVQKVVEMRVDCDQDVLLIRVTAAGPACHVGYRSCFFRAVELGDGTSPVGLKVVEDGKSFDPDTVYGKK